MVSLAPVDDSTEARGKLAETLAFIAFFYRTCGPLDDKNTAIYSASYQPADSAASNRGRSSPSLSLSLLLLSSLPRRHPPFSIFPTTAYVQVEFNIDRRGAKFARVHESRASIRRYGKMSRSSSSLPSSSSSSPSPPSSARRRRRRRRRLACRARTGSVVAE